jgi:hypothetical protein
MLRPRDSIAHWLRHGHGPLATTLRRAATSAVGTYGAYLGYGLVHGALREPYHGPEAMEALPGDELITRPDTTKTFVVDIVAAPGAVWPYLVQMGYGRAGWYGWYPLENGARGSARSIVEAHQDLAIGDLIPDGPRAGEGFGVWRVVDLDPPSAMVLYSRRVATTGREIAVDQPVDEPTLECSWAFVIRETGAGSTLIVRVRVCFLAMEDGLLGHLARRFFDVGDTVMEWTMVEGIKARAERRPAT